MLIKRSQLHAQWDSVSMEDLVHRQAMADRIRQPLRSEVSVFLSHKHDEERPLREAIRLLKGLGVSVYVDWMDEQMPSQTSGATAARIKSRIRDSSKFVLVATRLAIESKWCNWELGVADPLKYPQNMALLPLVENDGAWPGNEYLQVYPSIQTDTVPGRPAYYVEHQGQKVPLVDWLRR
jgi:hypothetical protein